MTGDLTRPDADYIAEAAGEDRWRVMSPQEAKQEFDAVAIRKGGISVRLRKRRKAHFVADDLA